MLQRPWVGHCLGGRRIQKTMVRIDCHVLRNDGEKYRH